MKGKFEFWDKLAADTQKVTAHYLSTPDLGSLARISEKYRTLFNPLIKDCKVRKMLHHVVRSEYAAVQKMLETDIGLMIKRSSVKDCSGRVFNNISSFEYALWALDASMCEEMFGCLRENEKAQPMILATLFAQYQTVKIHGVTYRLHEKVVTENHFDFSLLIGALQTYINVVSAPGPKDWTLIEQYWVEIIGGAQKLLPMHVVHQYCSEVSFSPLPMFFYSLNPSRQLHNLLTDVQEDWFSDDSTLGVEFAIHKLNYNGGRRVGKAVGSPTGFRQRCGTDLAFIEALFAVRTKGVINLASKFEEPVTVDEQVQSKGI